MDQLGTRRIEKRGAFALSFTLLSCQNGSGIGQHFVRNVMRKSRKCLGKIAQFCSMSVQYVHLEPLNLSQTVDPPPPYPPPPTKNDTIWGRMRMVLALIYCIYVRVVDPVASFRKEVTLEIFFLSMI